MRLIEGAVISKVEDKYVLVTVGVDFDGMIMMNETSAFIVRKLESEQSVDSLVGAVTEEYDVSEDDARENIENILRELSELKLLVE